MHNHFEHSRVSLHLGAGDFNEQSPDVQQYKFLMKCIGSKSNSHYMKANFSQCLEPNGRIKVNEYFQITNLTGDHFLLNNPHYYQGKKEKDLLLNFKGRNSETVFPNIFCFGDASSTLMNEEKSIVSIQVSAEIVAHNLRMVS
jgi:hypothetical protein